MPYIRDKRSPKPKTEAVSRVMSANRPTDTKPEIQLRKALCHAGLRGYRLHRRIILDSPPYQGGVSAPRRRGGSLSVRPDITYVSRKLAIFVHGYFWHRCPKCDFPLPKNNREFWKAKFALNVERDNRQIMALESTHWKVIVVWECETRSELDDVVRKISRLNRLLAKSMRRRSDDPTIDY